MVKNLVHNGSIGITLKAARKTNGISQAELSERLEIHRNTITNLELGRGSVDNLLAVVSALGLRLDGRSLPAGKNVGERLRQLRRRRKLSRASVCEVAGITAPTLIALESGQLGHLSALEKVGKALAAGLCLVPVDQPISFWSAAGNSTVHHGWETPEWLLGRLEAAIGGSWDLDPCSPGHGKSRVKARIHIGPAEDGLAVAWHGRVFVNPPYGKVLATWIAKCRGEVSLGNATLVIALVPARTDTRWWHAHIAGHADIWMLKGRLAFGDGEQPAPFPSALIAWGATPEQAGAVSAQFSDAWHVAL